MTTSEDASYSGCAFLLKHGVSQGQAAAPVDAAAEALPVSTTSPTPRITSTRWSATSRPSRAARAWARCSWASSRPEGFGENPGTSRFLLPNDPQAEPARRREHQRQDIFLNFRLEATGRQHRPAGGEGPVSENLSRRGARVLTTLAVARGEVLEVEELQGTFHTRAEIRNIYIGKDNIPRLNLRFLDADAPNRLILAG